jgi:ATP-dependent DNA ligase
MWPRTDLVWLKAKGYHESKLTGLVYVEPKYDGHRVIITREETERHIWTHGISVVTFEHGQLSIPHPDWSMPRWTAVECELFWPGHTSTDVPHAVKECPEELKYQPFAIPFCDGVDIREYPYLRTNFLLRELTGTAPEYREFQDPPPLVQLQDEARAKGLEGYMVKEFGYSHWWKAKVIHSLDLKVVGIHPGTGKYKGLVGSLILMDSKGMRIRCSGMDETIRFSITENDIGRLVEVKHNGVTPGGKLRHPRFIRWRDDKEEIDEIRDGFPEQGS